MCPLHKLSADNPALAGRATNLNSALRLKWKALVVLVCFVLLSGCALMRVRTLERKKDTVSVVTYNLSATVNAPVSEVWELTKLWNTYTVGYANYADTSSKGLTGIGNHSSGQASLAGRKVKWHETVAEWKDERLVRFVYSGDARGTVKIAMEPDGEKTRYHFTVRMFFLPDSILAKTLNSILEQGILGDYLNKTITDWLVKDFARLEKKKPEEVKLENQPVHSVFADAYLTASETFAMPPGKLFKILNSAAGLQSVLPVDSIVPVEGPEVFEGLGGHYTVTASEGLERPLVYDMVVVQYDPPREARYYLYAHDVCMEIDLLVIPTAKGSKALLLFILDMPDSVQGQALDALIHTSDIDKQAQKRLSALSEKR